MEFHPAYNNDVDLRNERANGIIHRSDDAMWQFEIFMTAYPVQGTAKDTEKSPPTSHKEAAVQSHVAPQP